MAQTSHTQFIELALSCTSSYAPSYPDPKQKWLIRKHLLSLIQSYPTFTLSLDTFIHNDGTTVNLLNAKGNLQVSKNTASIPIIIWLHEHYPFMPPIVFVSSNPTSPIHPGHPFVDPSGSTKSPYLETWMFPGRNLTELVHNLVKLFSHDHPFGYSSPYKNRFAEPSFMSKMEAIDRLSGMLHYDMMALLTTTEEEIEGLSQLQVQLVKRDDISKSMVIGLEHEKMNLNNVVTNLMGQADVLRNWLMVNDPKSGGTIEGEEGIEDAFEAVDEETKLVIDYLASDKAMDDLLIAVDKAFEEGVVCFDAYIRQVRVLAREQFSHRALAVKLRGPSILRWLDL